MAIPVKKEETCTNMADIRVFSEAAKRGHEQVSFFNFPQVGLKALVGIHNTALGPALGGCRMRLYESEEDALDDVMRLSEGMTYKSSIAGLDLGGGKCVLIADPKLEEGRRELFLQFGECLNRLNGMYITAEDMGTSVEDIMVMRQVTKYAAGFALEEGGSGDPSPWTARGVFNAIQAACERRYGSKSIDGKHITVQGVGHVGIYLIGMLKKAGARTTVCDTNEIALQRAKQDFGSDVVGLDEIYDLECDVYSPCAIGQTVNANTIPRLKCDIIAGAANNQLTDESVHAMITERELLYCPDFVINSGGVISVGGEYIEGGWSKQWVTEKVRNIEGTMHRILDESQKRGLFPEVTAMELAKERVKQAEQKRASGAAA
jgi:leucine dehydrogenase